MSLRLRAATVCAAPSKPILAKLSWVKNEQIVIFQTSVVHFGMVTFRSTNRPRVRFYDEDA
jgi:hypothetical protein